MKKHVLGFISAAILPLTLSFLLLIYAPLDLFFKNRLEFNYNMYELLGCMLPLMLAVSLLLIIPVILLRKSRRGAYSIFVLLMLAVLLSSYIQGTFLTGNLPPLDGRAIQWKEYDAQRWESIVLWAGIAAGLFLLLKKLGNERFFKFSSACAGGILVLLGVALLLTCLMSGGYHRNKVIVHSDSALLDMADKQENLVIFLMDAVDGEKFQEVLQFHPEYESVFEDFTFFDNVVSAYPYTSRAVPFILSGIWYENQEPFENYCSRAFEESPLFQELKKRGYRMGMYDPEFSFVTSLDGKFENVSSAAGMENINRFILMQLKLIGYRFFPYDLKKACYMTPEEIYLASLKTNGQEQYYSMDNMVFLKRMEEREVVYSDTGCFRYIYIRGAHEPFIYEAQCAQTEDHSYESSIELCVQIAGEYLQKLKTAGVYDNTAIVILADHGYAEDNASFGRQNPALFIKGTGEKHAFQFSDIPLSHEDLQEIFLRLLDGAESSAVSVWQEGDQRERRFLFFEYEDEEHMTEYVQLGPAGNEETMVATGNIYDLKS